MDIYKLLNSSDNETRVLGLSLLEKYPNDEQDLYWSSNWKIRTFYFKDDLISEIILLHSKDPLKFKAKVYFKNSYNNYVIREIYLNQEQYTYFYDKWMLIINNKDFNK